MTYKRLPDGRLVKVIRRQVPKSASEPVGVKAADAVAPAASVAESKDSSAVSADKTDVSSRAAAKREQKVESTLSEADKSATEQAVETVEEKNAVDGANTADTVADSAVVKEKKERQPKVKAKKPDKKKKRIFTSEMERVEADPEIGLTEEQVEERTLRGYNNVQPNIVTKSYFEDIQDQCHDAVQRAQLLPCGVDTRVRQS